jgi:hypothetical protein
MRGGGRSTDTSALSQSGVQQCQVGEVNPDNLTDEERQLVEKYRRLDPAHQRVLRNALQHLASGVPGARLVLAVDR